MSDDMKWLLQTAVPIDDIDMIVTGPTSGLAVVWCDISDRPDLQTLAERHETENGYSVCQWIYGRKGEKAHIIILRVEMKKPSKTNFHLAFSPRKWSMPLHLIAQTGKLWIVPGPPPAHLVGTQWMNSGEFTQKVVAHSGKGVVIELDYNLRNELSRELSLWQ